MIERLSFWDKRYSIEGEKVSLCPITSEDTPLILKWRNSSDVKRFFIYQKDLTEKDHLNWLDTKVRSGEVVQFIIHEKENGQPVGSIYYHDVDPYHEKAEYGIFIGEAKSKGKGIGTEAGQLFTKFGFEELKLHKIYLRVLADNNKAIRSYEKIGFSQEGRFKDEVKINGVFHDVIFMALFH